MSKKKSFIGIAVLLTGIWFYSALSTFEIDDSTFPKKLIISSGTVRTADEVAGALSKEMGFDLEGAYKSGYTSDEVIQYLIKEPHSLDVTFYNGRYYHGRKTVPRIVPLIFSIVIIIIGSVFTLLSFRSKKQ